MITCNVSLFVETNEIGKYVTFLQESLGAYRLSMKHVQLPEQFQIQKLFMEAYHVQFFVEVSDPRTLLDAVKVDWVELTGDGEHPTKVSFEE